MPGWLVRRAFPVSSLRRIEQAISESERGHQGEIRVAMEGGLGLGALLADQGARERAVEVFAALRVWDTEHNSGVLLYVQLADRKVEILADRGISRRVAQPEWQDICREMEQAFRARLFERGVLHAVERITALLVRHFPPGADNPDELVNRPVVL